MSRVIRGVLRIDLAPAADQHGTLVGRDAAALVPMIPAGASVELDIGNTVPLDGLLHPLFDMLHPASGITVTGTNARGIGILYNALWQWEANQ